MCWQVWLPPPSRCWVAEPQGQMPPTTAFLCCINAVLCFPRRCDCPSLSRHTFFPRKYLGSESLTVGLIGFFCFCSLPSCPLRRTLWCGLLWMRMVSASWTTTLWYERERLVLTLLKHCVIFPALDLEAWTGHGPHLSNLCPRNAVL